MSNKDYKHLFFDLDKTLWDFKTNSREAISELCSHYLVDYNFKLADFIVKYEEVNEFYWSQYRDGNLEKKILRKIRFEKTLEHFDIRDSRMAQEMGEEYIKISPFKTTLMDGTMSSLEYLKIKGYIIHIITNGFEEVQNVKIEQSGLSKFLDVIVTSEQAGAKKPHIDVFDFALLKSGAEKNESIMIGDDMHADIIGAKNAGIDQVYFNPDKIEHNEEVTYEINNIIELKQLF